MHLVRLKERAFGGPHDPNAGKAKKAEMDRV
ncbi:hypothetical protein JOC55_005637 [Paenibacillus sacheonensis]|nr:hypothetical protein [Paenibacillus sacheonensis]